MITDPWTVPVSSRSAVVASASSAIAVAAEFEDNFQPSTCDNSVAPPSIIAAEDNANNVLPDSKEYLASLERKLHKLKTDTGVLQQLTARREHCIERLLQGQIDLPTAAEFGFDALDESVEQPAGVVGDLVRHIRPEQAVHPAELLHLIQYDQLQPPTVSAQAATVEPASEETCTTVSDQTSDDISR